MTKQICAACTLVLIFFISGCLYIPPLSRQTGENDVRKIQVGVTTKQELIELLGEPEILDEGRFSVCDAFEGYGALIWFAGGHDGAVKLWDSATGLVKRSFDAHDGEIVSIEFSPDGKMIASVGWDKTVCIWETSTGIELATLRSKRDYGKDPVVKFSPDGGTLAVHRGYHVELWKVAMKESSVDSRRPELSYHLADVFIQPVCPYVGFWKTSLAFSPDGHTIVASAGTAVMFDITTSSLVWRFVPTGDKFRNDGINGLAFSPDGKSLTAATNNGVYLWEFQRGE